MGLIFMNMSNMCLIQIQALISTLQKHMEFIIHLNQDRKKWHVMSHICTNLFHPRPELGIKVESVFVFLDITKVVDFW